MLKLKLENIKKSYTVEKHIPALNGVTLGFRESEFVSILGPSGSGKTTLLNVIGGLDHYTSGDLIINGMSTKQFKDSDWDAYRNSSIGFVFQSYNLIGHQTVLQNVEIALTLSGISPAERKRRAKQALTDVGLSDHIMKRPNQLSGGQMQRVAIARALINNPDIILADEPTGALDSHTSVQIMDILKDVAKTRLVIMVTHNGELAEQYSNRIIRLLDGEIQSDSNPITKEDESRKSTGQAGDRKKIKKTSMSVKTAATLSFKNLLTKKGRTITTAIAGSIGIIGVALVLALSNGLSSYMDTMQTDMMSGFPVTISTSEQSVGINVMAQYGQTETYDKFPNSGTIYSYDSSENQTIHTNVLTDDYLNYIGKMETELPDAVNTISYQRGVNMNLLAKAGDTVVKFETSSAASGMGGMASMMGIGGTYWQEMPDHEEFVLSQYDLIGDGSRLPETKNEVAIVVDEYNRLDVAFFEKLGLSGKETYNVNDFIGKTIFKVVDNNDFYAQNGEMYTAANPSEYTALYDDGNGVSLTVVGILRLKESAASGYFSEGFIYTTALTDYVVESAKNSEIAKAQTNNGADVLTGVAFANDMIKKSKLQGLGADTTPTGVNIYPTDAKAKDSVKEYLDAYNEGKTEENQVIYSDMAETFSSTMGTMINMISLVLVVFAAISLVVSTIMIAIIIYVSVIERTKEIGILRSVGARKKDISMVFNAEALLIGFTAGVIGVGMTYLLSWPVNLIIKSITDISNIASLNPIWAVILILGSMLLTLIAGFFPSKQAARKDPVEALRTE